MANLNSVVKLSTQQCQTLFTDGTITVGDITLTYTDDAIYLTPFTLNTTATSAVTTGTPQVTAVYTEIDNTISFDFLLPAPKQLFIRYSANADGSNMTDTWTSGQNYMGTYIGGAAPSDPDHFVWTRFVGPQGTPGTNGSNGTNGTTPHIGTNGDWYVGTTDTGVHAKGDKGDVGFTVSISGGTLYITGA